MTEVSGNSATRDDTETWRKIIQKAWNWTSSPTGNMGILNRADFDQVRSLRGSDKYNRLTREIALKLFTRFAIDWENKKAITPRDNPSWSKKKTSKEKENEKKAYNTSVREMDPLPQVRPISPTEEKRKDALSQSQDLITQAWQALEHNLSSTSSKRSRPGRANRRQGTENLTRSSTLMNNAVENLLASLNQGNQTRSQRKSSEGKYQIGDCTGNRDLTKDALKIHTNSTRQSQWTIADEKEGEEEGEDPNDDTFFRKILEEEQEEDMDPIRTTQRIAWQDEPPPEEIFIPPDPTDPEVITTSSDEETDQECVPMDTSDSD